MGWRSLPWGLARRLAGGMALLGVVATTPIGAADAADSAVILMYHRFGEDRFPSTNIRLEQFEAHIAELTSGGYAVLPVPEIVDAIRNGAALPDKTVGITIDDAFASVYAEAWPRLRDAGLPFTVFVATDPVEQNTPGHMSWDQIRELRDGGVTIGHHTGSHLHMARSARATNEAELARASGAFVRELGEEPALFAFPYGEASDETISVVEAAGINVAFGQHSGPVHRQSNMMYLPRFSLNESHGDLAQFRQRTQTVPLAASEITPANPTLTENPPAFGFTLAGDVPSGLACYPSGQDQAELEVLGPRVEVRGMEPFGAGRARINCTARREDGRWHWLGMLYYVPKAVAEN